MKKVAVVLAVVVLGAILVLGSMAIYEECDEGTLDQPPSNYVSRYTPVDGQERLWDALCNGVGKCTDVYHADPEWFFGGRIGLVDCARDQTATLFGEWPDGDAGPWHFAWRAEVRVGGVFPSLGQATTITGCIDMHWQIHSPTISLAVGPDRLAWARLEDDDVFVPFQGSAALDHTWVATAALEATDGAPPRIDVSVHQGDASLAAFDGLKTGDSFPWGPHRAVVFRIVPPQPGMLGAVGWVEVRLY
jgi:hypothetical protein